MVSNAAASICLFLMLTAPADADISEHLRVHAFETELFDDERSGQPNAAGPANGCALGIISSTALSINIVGEFRDQPALLFFGE